MGPWPHVAVLNFCCVQQAGAAPGPIPFELLLYWLGTQRVPADLSYAHWSTEAITVQEFSQYAFYMQPRTHLILDQVGHIISAWPEVLRHVLQCYLAQLLQFTAVTRQDTSPLDHW